MAIKIEQAWIRDPKVFIIVNSTPECVIPPHGSKADTTALLDKARDLLEREKDGVCDFLIHHGFHIEQDCIIENKNRPEVLQTLERRIADIEEPHLGQACTHDSVLMWIFGIESKTEDHMIYLRDDALTSDSLHALFKKGEGIEMFVDKPKLFIFCMLRNQEFEEHIKSATTVQKLPIDADFFTYCIRMSVDNYEEQQVSKLMMKAATEFEGGYELMDLVYAFNSDISEVTSTPTFASTLRKAVFFETPKAASNAVTTPQAKIDKKEEEDQPQVMLAEDEGSGSEDEKLHTAAAKWTLDEEEKKPVFHGEERGVSGEDEKGKMFHGEKGMASRAEEGEEETFCAQEEVGTTRM